MNRKETEALIDYIEKEIIEDQNLRFDMSDYVALDNSVACQSACCLAGSNSVRLIGLNQTILEIRKWRDEIKLVGSTANREVRIFYWKGLVLPTDENSVLGFIQAEDRNSLISYGIHPCYTVSQRNLELTQLQADILFRSNYVNDSDEDNDPWFGISEDPLLEKDPRKGIQALKRALELWASPEEKEVEETKELELVEV